MRDLPQITSTGTALGKSGLAALGKTQKVENNGGGGGTFHVSICCPSLQVSVRGTCHVFLIVARQGNPLFTDERMKHYNNLI